MRHSRRAVVDPLPTALLDSLTDAIHADLLVVVATNRKNGCHVPELANQVTQTAQLGGTVHQVTAEQHHIRMAPGHGLQYLPAQRLRAGLSEVDVADIQQSTCVGPRRESLLSNVQGST